MPSKSILLISLVLPAVGLAWLLGLGTPTMMSLPRPFDSERWKQATEWDYARCEMVFDLRHRIGLVGRTVADVHQMLGPTGAEVSGMPAVYVLCPSVTDYYILELEWKNGFVVSTLVRDT